MTRVTKAVFPAAELETRFLPAAKAMPKKLLPIIQYAVEEARDRQRASGLTGGMDQILITGGAGLALMNVRVENFSDKSEL